MKDLIDLRIGTGSFFESYIETLPKFFYFSSIYRLLKYKFHNLLELKMYGKSQTYNFRRHIPILN